MSTPEKGEPIVPPVTDEGPAPRVIETMSPELKDIVRGLMEVQANSEPPVVRPPEVSEPRIVPSRIRKVTPRVVQSRVVPPRKPN